MHNSNNNKIYHNSIMSNYSYVYGDHYYYLEELIELINLVDIERRTKRDENPGQTLKTNFKEDLVEKLKATK